MPGSLATVPVNVAVAECAPGCVAGVLGKGLMVCQDALPGSRLNV